MICRKEQKKLIILLKMNKNMKIIVFIGLILIFTSCEYSSNEPKEFDKGKLYRSYFHVRREINEDEKEVYYYDYTPLNKMQRDTLINILKQRQYKYFLSCDSSDLLISVLSLGNAFEMSSIDLELKSRLGKNMKDNDWSR